MAVCTYRLAATLLWGNSGLEVVCVNPQVSVNILKFSEANWGAFSEIRRRGILLRVNHDLILATIMLDFVEVIFAISMNPEK